MQKEVLNYLNNMLQKQIQKREELFRQLDAVYEYDEETGYVEDEGTQELIDHLHNKLSQVCYCVQALKREITNIEFDIEE